MMDINDIIIKDTITVYKNGKNFFIVGKNFPNVKCFSDTLQGALFGFERLLKLHIKGRIRHPVTQYVMQSFDYDGNPIKNRADLYIV